MTQLILILTAALSPFIFLRQCFDYADLPQRAFVVFCTALLGILVKDVFKPFPRFGAPLLACVAWAGMSVLWAHNKTEALWALSYWGVITWLYFMTAKVFSNSATAFVKWLLTAVFAAGFLTSALGFIQYLCFPLQIPQSVPPAATFANRNMAVQFVTMAVPLALLLWRKAEWKIAYPAIATAAATMLAYVVIADNRTGWLVVCCQGAVLGIWCLGKRFGKSAVNMSGGSASETLLRLRRIFSPKYAPAILQKSPKTELKQSIQKNSTSFHRRVALVYGLVLFVFLTSMSPSGFRFTSVTNMSRRVQTAVSEAANSNTGKRDASVALRKALYLNSLAMLKDKPLFGCGLGNHKVFYPRYCQAVVKDGVFSENAQLHNCHNDYLQWVCETGAVGAVLLSWLTISVLLAAFRSKSEISLGLLALAIAAMFSFPMQRAIPPVIFVVYLAVLEKGLRPAN